MMSIRPRRRRVTVATYNVHQWIGTDGVLDSSRVLRVIRELQPDVIGLQEVTFSPAGEPAAGKDYLSAATEFEVILGPTFFRENVHFGNVLLTKHRVFEVRRVDLSVDKREPRGALDVDMELHGASVRTIVTHFGLRAAERRRQGEKLLKMLAAGPSNFVIIMGDFNEWYPVRGWLRRLRSWAGFPPTPRTFPSRFPLLPLDQILVFPRQALAAVAVHRTRLSRIASDHLPVIGIMRE